METDTVNTRVLIIDDEKIVRESMIEILAPRKTQQSASIQAASSILFDDEEEEMVRPMNENIPIFKVEQAVNGMDGLEKVKISLAEKIPFAVIFLDMRMPGWDGLETALRIREIDQKVEIIIVTAYSDKSIEEIVEKAGQNIGYHCKPYSSEEILQLANKGVSDYNKLRNLEKLIDVIATINLTESHLNTLLQNILDQVALYIGSSNAMLGVIKEPLYYQRLFTVGVLDVELKKEKLDKILTATHTENEVIQVDDVVFIKLDEYAIFAVLGKNELLKLEKLYLLKLFVQNAAKVIKNTQLYEQLLQKEKLSAVGKALSMLIHDLRSPVKNISEITTLLREQDGTNELLDLIDQSAAQASEIFDDFMDFIREAPLEIKPVNLEDLLYEIIVLLRQQKDVSHIIFDIDIKEGVVLAAEGRKLKRIFLNLINNANEAMQSCGVKEPRISITARKVNDLAQIKLADNGAGIPDKILTNLFEPFVSLNKANGTGLGLAIVKQYVQAHKGSITAANNNGAEFIIWLPLAL